MVLYVFENWAYDYIDAIDKSKKFLTEKVMLVINFYDPIFHIFKKNPCIHNYDLNARTSPTEYDILLLG